MKDFIRLNLEYARRDADYMLNYFKALYEHEAKLQQLITNMTFEQFVKCCCDSLTMLSLRSSNGLVIITYDLEEERLSLQNFREGLIYYDYSPFTSSTNLFDEFAKFEDALLRLLP